MPRPTRISLAGLVYHIINRGNNRQDVFKDEEDFLTYDSILGSDRFIDELREKLAVSKPKPRDRPKGK